MPRRFLSAAVLCLLPLAACAAERITLRTGFQIDCVRRVVEGDHVRLYLTPGDDSSFLEIPATAIASVEAIPDLPGPAAAPATAAATSVSAAAPLAAPATLSDALNPSAGELQQLLSTSGAAHNIDSALLAAVVHAESGGHAHAVSRTGARGLMQLMPGTAQELGVLDSFRPAQNVEGGTRYLDQLLTRYHDNIALALAAYNAGPGAVDRFHGVPPFRETRAYVSRVIREFNRRKLAALATATR